MSWRDITIEDLGRVVTGKTPETKNRAFYDGIYPFVTPSDIGFNHYMCEATETTVTDLARDRLPNQFIPGGSVIVTCIGNTIGKTAIAATECLTNQQMNSIVVREAYDEKFVYYLMCQNVEKLRSVGLGGGAAQPIINKSTFCALKVRVPEKCTQTAIAKILTAYDDQIANNTRRINLLERSARLLFEEWFVRLRYPGHERDKVVDGVPEGWERTTVPSVIDINPREPNSKGEELWYIPMSALSVSGMTLDAGDFERRSKHTSVKFRNGDTLFARITPCLENGKTGFVDFLENGEIACGSTEFIVLRGKNVSPEFTYCLSRSDYFRGKAIKSMIGSSGRQRVQDSCFNEFVVAVAPRPIMAEFNEIASSCFLQIKNLRQEDERLVRARDLLLPRLMDGRIEV